MDGQPSILLPAWMFGGLAALTLIAASGVAFRVGRARRSDDDHGRLMARRLMAIGIVLMCVPIVYGPAIAGRNLWYGRWLFAMLGPLIAALVVGTSAFAQAARRNPHRVAAWLAAVVAVAWLAWLAAPGDAMRSAIDAHHYGDRARLVETCRDVLVALAGVAAAIEIGSRLSWPRMPQSAPIVCFVAAGLANAALLTAYIRPLYAPLRPEEYAALIADYLGAGDTPRAANTYASAVKSYPDARVISDLADAAPRLLLGGDSPASRARLWEWLARGHRLDDRDALLMLAHEASAGGDEGAWRRAGAVDAVIADARRSPDLAEPAALLQLAVDGDLAGGDPSRFPIELAHGRRFGGGTPMRHGEAMFDGFTVFPRGTRGTQLIVYFRPHAESANRRLWLHAYPNGLPPFLDLTPTIPPVWNPDALAWAVYDLPPGRFGVYLGLWVGSDIGDATLLGAIP